MIAMVGTTYGLISAVELPDHPTAHESPFFAPPLQETASNYSSIELVCLDRGYLSRDNCDLIEEVGAVPRIYPKEGTTLKRKGSWAWAEMLLDFIEDPQRRPRDYHLRSISETVFSAYKRDFPTPLRKRILRRKKKEAFSRVCDYNMKRLCYLWISRGLPCHGRIVSFLSQNRCWDAPLGPYNEPNKNLSVEDNRGYWVKENQDDNVAVYGDSPKSHTIYLAAGWNLVGFPVTSENTTPKNLFSGLDYAMYYWEAPYGSYGEAPDNAPVKLGVGYWVKVNQSTTATVPLCGSRTRGNPFFVFQGVFSRFIYFRSINRVF